MCVIQDPMRETETVIVNNQAELFDYYVEYKNEIFIGYNIREYDAYIFKAILAGFDPYEISNHIVDKHLKGYSFDPKVNQYSLITYDLLQLGKRLKDLEGFQGHSIYETGVDFKIDRKLTNEEIEETVKYCRNDVDETRELFLILMADFNVQMELIKNYKLPLKCISLTQTQLTAEIMQAKKCEAKDDFDLTFQPYLNNIKRYKYIVDYYKNLATPRHLSDTEKKEIYSKKLTTTVAGCPHTFGWGGAHGALPKYVGVGIYLHIDVHQYYPSLAIANGYFSRGTSEEGKRRYKIMKEESIRLKAFPELKNKRAGYKLCNNKMTGGLKDKYSKLYDPKQNNNITVGGQLAILLLVEMLEDYVQLIQNNTDGIIVKLNSIDDYELVDDICYEWEQLTDVGLGFDPVITKIWQKDVNNYLFIDEDGKVERRGDWLKELGVLDFDLAIVTKALVDYMIDEVQPSVTINNCNELIMFQKIVKLSGKYEHMEHNKTKYTYKTYRVFASTKFTDGTIYACRNNTRAKVANTPTRCFIDNSDIRGKSIPSYLDKSYYIKLAESRLEQIGVEEFKSQLEFKF